MIVVVSFIKLTSATRHLDTSGTSLQKILFKTFKPFNRFAPFKPFKAGIESRIPTKLCLKFTDDRRRYLHWLFEAKKRFGLCVLDYDYIIVTSNHVHLLYLA